MAGNQLGKTVAGAAEMGMHLTGRYPDWWEGRRFAKPIVALAGSESAELTRKGVQRLLLGPPADEDAWGTGFIPGDDILDWSRRRSVADAVDTIVVRHVSGGSSTITLNSYDQGRTKWQADTADVVWFDEEPPQEIYSEGLTRTNATGGMAYMTFTPLMGQSEVVSKFLNGGDGAAHRGTVTMTIDDAAHIAAEDRDKIISAYPEHEREARIMGIPSLGSGRVFPVTEASILVDSMPIPRHWPQIVGIDFGWDHPFAAARLAWDRDADIVYVATTYRESKQTPPIHAAAIRPWGPWFPIARPHDRHQHEKGNGAELAAQYTAQGLNTLPTHAHHEEDGYSLEASVLDMLERMQTGRFKVFRGLEDWLGEFRLYHRDKGRIVDLKDDLLSATRYALMMLRFAAVQAKKIRVADPGQHGWMG